MWHSMNRILQVAVALAAVALPVAAAAEPIRVSIESGVAEFAPDEGSISLRGTSGFELTGSLLEGSFGLAHLPLPPGHPFRLDSVWTGIDLPSTVRYEGRTFTDVGGLTAPSSALVEFTAGFVTPLQLSGPATVRTPFTLNGLFLGAAEDGSDPFSLQLHGSGTATVFLEPVVNVPDVDDHWLWRRVRFDMESVGPTPIPEPGTLWLLGIGVAGALRAARRRRA